MEVEIEIETYDVGLSFDLFESKEIRAGETQKTIADGVSVRCEGGLIRKAEGIPQIVRIALIITETVALPLAVSIAANWLYDKLRRKKVEKLRIGRVEVKVDKGEIERILIEKIERS